MKAIVKKIEKTVYVDDCGCEHDNERECVVSNLKHFINTKLGSSKFLDTDDVANFIIGHEVEIKDFYTEY